MQKFDEEAIGDEAFDYDVAVIGLGSMGAAAAWQLASRGAKVIGFEQFPRGHANGSHHGGSRMIRKSYFEDPLYVPLLERAYQGWEKLDQLSRERGGEQILHITGGIYAGRPDSATVAGAKASAEKWGMPYDILTPDMVSMLYPQFSVREDEVGFYDATAGFVRPEATVELCQTLAEEAGAELHFSTPVEEVEQLWDWTVARDEEGNPYPVWPFGEGDVAMQKSGAGVRIRISGDDTGILVRRVVVCGGAWTGKLLGNTMDGGAALSLEEGLYAGSLLSVERQVMHWFDPGMEFPDMEIGPVYISDRDGEEVFYGFPASDGPDGGAKVAYFRIGSRTDPDMLERDVSEAEIEHMRARLRGFLPGLAEGQHLKSKACLYTCTPDEHFIIGACPVGNDPGFFATDGPDPARDELPDVTIACGFSGHGFKFVPVIGEILADLALEGTTGHDISLFDPRRFYDDRGYLRE